jgi:hypothetical protein
MFWEFQEDEGQKEKENKSDDNERFSGMEKERRESGGRIEVKVEGRGEDTSHNPRSQP